jgi:hypothetical protein
MEPREYEPYFIDTHVTDKFTIKDLAVMDDELYVLFVENSPKLGMPNRVAIRHVNPYHKLDLHFTRDKIKF